MNWSRYKLLIVSGVICLLLSAGSLFWWMKSRAANQKQEKDIQSLSSQLTRLQSEPIFPSEASKKQLEAEQSKVRSLRDSVSQQITAGQLEPRRMVRSRFGDFIRGFVPSLQEAAKVATKGGEQGVLLEDPSFGLSEYLEEGKLPEPDEIPGLMLELEVVDYVARKLFEGGISELVSVAVVHAEEEAETPGARNRLPGAFGPAPRGFGQQPGSDVKSAEEGASSWTGERDRLFDALRITLKFKVYEDYLWGLLTDLMGDANQFVVTGVHITNDNEKLWPASITPLFRSNQGPKPGPGGGMTAVAEMMAMMETGVAKAEQKEENMIPIAGLSERRQRTTGGELLGVQLNVTLYRLKPQPEPATLSEGL